MWNLDLYPEWVTLPTLISRASQFLGLPWKQRTKDSNDLYLAIVDRLEEFKTVNLSDTQKTLAEKILREMSLSKYNLPWNKKSVEL